MTKKSISDKVLLPAVIFFALFILVLIYADDNIINRMKVASSLLIAMSVAITAMQFSFNREQVEKNNEWNTKQFGITETHQSRKMIKDSISKLRKHLDTIERKTPYEVHEIHNIFGVFLTDDRFVFHGEKTDADMRLLPEHDYPDGHIASFKDIDGREIKNELLNLIGEYEYICLGVNNKTFHRESVLSLVAGPIRRNYFLFSKYIKHLQYYHEYGKSVFSEFRYLGLKLKWEKRKMDRDKIVSK